VNSRLNPHKKNWTHMMAWKSAAPHEADMSRWMTSNKAEE
jgi:hypothetical protein